jgi:hypothetical protein
MQDIPRSKGKYRAWVILIRYKTNKGKYKYSFLYSNLDWDAVEVYEFYNSRQCIDIIRTDKSFLNIKNLRTRDFCGISAFLYLAFLTHNLLNLFSKAVLEPLGLGDIGIRNLVRKLMNVPAKVVREIAHISLLFPTGHYYTTKLLS